MKVITRHGENKPDSKELIDYQLAWSTSERKYGFVGDGAYNGDGKILYIKDGNEEDSPVKAVTEGFLREEFVNYVLPCDDDGNIVETDGKTKYAEVSGPEAKNLFGLTAGLSQTKNLVIDENGNTMGTMVSLNFLSINTKERKFTNSGHIGDSVRIMSVDPTYLQNLKNSLEQKALYTVDTYGIENEESTSTLIGLVKKLAEDKVLEDGVQIIVKHDEYNNDDSILYAMTRVASEGTEELEANKTYLVKKVKNEAGEETFEPIEKITSNIGEKGQHVTLDIAAGETIYVKTDYCTLTPTPVTDIEYKYHDPIGMSSSGEDIEAAPTESENADANGLGIYVVKQDDVANTSELALTKHTVSAIVTGYEEATKYDSTEFGVKCENISSDILNSNVNSEGVRRNVDGAKYTNYLTMHEKIYHDDGSVDNIVKYIDFGDFILDEGTWDN